MNRRIVAAIAATAMLLTALLPGVVLGRSPSTATRPLPDSVRSMKLDKTVTQPDLKSKVHKDLVSASGRQKVLVRLDATPAVDLAGRGASAQVAQVRRIKAQQKSFMASVKRLDRKAIFLGQTQRATNIVALQVDASKIATLAKNPHVVSIVPVVNYTKALSETVPYIGATAVQAAGFKGNGVRVGIIDSGIDYTHVEFGGAGTAAAYEAAYGTSTDDSRNTTLDGLFPTSRVKGGFDFVGESWPLDDEIEDPDPDPIDFEGHGTHVADIVGGTHGVAPKVSLYALKVCSSVDTACSGVGLIRAMDWAIDPNGDGSTKDHLDIVNMSLGSDYGESFDDDLSLAIDAASKLGMLTVAAAGNGGNAPYIAGTPANAKSALSVAQTQVPSALARPLVVDAPDSIAGVYPNTETVTWAPITDGFSGDVVYLGRGCPAGSVDGQDEEDDYPAGADPTGKVALIDRGACSVSLKVDRAAKAGATAVLIGLVAPGAPISFSNGGGDTFVQTLIITQELSEAIKSELDNHVTVTVSVSNAVTIPLVGSMVNSSARGPSSPDNAIKPEIGAPGASVSAIAGSGTGMEGFGGTSGATPMITGSAALLRQAFPHRSINVLKAMLVNNGETTTYNDLANDPGYLAPITRIGGGEVRVNRALTAKAGAWDKSTKLGLLSFELRDVTAKKTTITKTVEVRNFSSSTRTWAISSTFRYANDHANGAVKIATPSHITLHAGETGSFKVTMTIKESKLRPWKLDSGPNALNADALDTQEYDGYIWLNDTSTSSDNNKKLHLAWQVLPRKSARITATPRPVPIDGTVSGGVFDGGVYTGAPAGTLHLHNSGFGIGAVDTYSLVGTSPNLPTARRGTNTPIIDLKSIGVQTFPVPADFCSDNASFVYVIAVSTWERHSTIGAVPGEYDVFFDTNRDGDPDFVVFNAAANGAADISELTFSLDLNDPDAEPEAFFYADNGTNDSNTLLTICGEQIGMDATNFGDLMDVSVGAFDNYFTGNLTDTIEGITVAPLGERYLGIFDADGTISGNVPANGSSTVKVVDFGALGTNPSEIGLLLVNNAFRSPDYHGGAPVGFDATRVRVSP